jgi:arylsulfatase A-like enzyme/predicted Zn-dependent protease
MRELMSFKTPHLGRAGAALASVLLLGGLAYWALARPPAFTPASLERRWGRLGAARPNVVLVTLDTTRADHLGCYGYPQATTPNLDALARHGAVFTHASSVAPLTLPAHSSILTGMQPTFHGVRVNGSTALGQSQDTLAEVLSAKGYQTGAFVGAFVLDGRWGLNQGFDHYDDRFDLKKYKHLDLAAVQRPGNEVMDAALAWLESHKQGPFFAWIHLYDAHSPYEPPEPFLSRYQGRGPAGLYDGEIAFADAEIGRLLDRLRAAGLDQRTVIAVVGDHGEALGGHGELTHGYFLYQDTLAVPLILRLPGRLAAGREVEQPVSTIDLFPTLLELTGAAVPQEAQGRSLSPLVEGRAWTEPAYAYSESMSPYLQFGWSPMFSLRSGGWKYVDAPQPELYDLAADPGETLNLADRERPVVRELRRALEDLHRRSGAGAPRPDEANLDAETLARLAALGYVGGTRAASRDGLADPRLADPKSKLEIYEQVSLAGELVNRGDYAQAATHLETVLAQDPGVGQAKLLLSTCYAKTGKSAEALRLLDELLVADPNDEQSLVAMATLLAREGRPDDVIAIAQRALAVDERNTQAQQLLGEVFLERGDPRGALPHLRRAVDIQPKLHRNRQNLAACLIALHQLDEAQTLLDGILAEHPKFPLARYHLGLLWEERGDFARARQAYLDEIAEVGDSVPARFNLGQLSLRMGDQRGYCEQMERVVALAPDRAKGYLFLARGLLTQPAELERAEQLVQRGLALADTAELRALGYFLLADIYGRRGDRSAAAQALARAERFAGGRGKTS